jgi:hypothetical protein
MNRSLATTLALGLALVASAAAIRTASAQQTPTDCNAFLPLRDDAQKKAAAIKAAGDRKADRKEMCDDVTRFAAAETLVVKFFETNKTWCAIPDQVVANAKAQHENTLKFRTAVCSEAAAKPKVPTLSDAIGTPTVDSSKNTKTGQGTFDTLTGNPLAR